MDVQITPEALFKQAAEQINIPESLAALETQADINGYVMQSLIADLQSYGGTGKITLSPNTLAVLAVLQSIQEAGTVTDADITKPDTSRTIQATLTLKKATRGIQMIYYKMKAKLGLSF